MDDDQVSSFIAVTGADEHIARQLLDITHGDLSQAVVLFYDTDMAETLRLQTSTSTAAAAASAVAARAVSLAAEPLNTSGSRGARHPIGREDHDGVIHIDSDDDDDDDDDGLDDDLDYGDHDNNFQVHGSHSGHGTHGAHDAHDAHDTHMADAHMAETVARTAQEEEDEAMAKRLQEEMYAENPAGASGASDGIRAPIGRTTEMLVEPSYGSGGYYGGGSGYGDYGGPSIYEQMRRRPAGGSSNPFNQIWDDEMSRGPAGAAGATGGASSQSSSTNAPTSRQARLADLFRPPYDLIERLPWDEARSVGRAEKRWVLVNIQDMSDFQCQALNRDIWKDEAVKELVKENFVFLQYSKDDRGAESYIQYYLPGGQHENPDNYPHVGIVDPRTGEQVKVWSGRPFPSALEFHTQLVEFLDRYSLDSTKKNPVQRTKSRAPVKDVDRMTEEEMLEMALQNSLETAGGSGSGNGSGMGSGAENGGSSRPSVQDPDELTTLPTTDAEGKGKEKAAHADEEDASVDETSAGSAAFARIASDRPHVEPPHNPATTTRIQFRHPDGRIIRRFATSDTVVRIYEWLKAAPLQEDKAGVEFELKAMPQAHDLLEDLDKTIEEAGLKQATVMIEYVE